MANFNIKATTTKDLCFKWLSALSGFMPLSKKELLVLMEFLSIYMDTKDIDLFRTKNRKKVRIILKMSTNNINNYINSLKKKQAIYITDEDSGLSKILIPKINDGNISININISYK